MILLNCKEAGEHHDTESDKASSETVEKAEFSIIIHGGAGTILKKKHDSRERGRL